MGKYYIKTIRTMLLLAVVLLYGATARASALGIYSKEHPLVIVCDWDLPPYEFLDDNGSPAGYTIELMSRIMEKMMIPYTFVLKDNEQITELFKNRKADLFVAPSFMLGSDSCYQSSNVLNYYKTKVAMRADEPPLRSVKDISEDKVVVLRKGGRIVANGLRDMKNALNLQAHAPMEALYGVLSGKYDYFMWGEEPLKWKIKELNIEGLRVDEIDVPIVELHVGSYDKELVEAFDDYYARMEQTGDLDGLREKWFHPERHHDNASPLWLYIAAAVLALMLLLFMMNRLIGRRVKRMKQLNSDQTRLMNMALDLGGYMVTEYNPKKDVFTNLRGKLMDERKNLAQSIDTLHAEDREIFQKKVQDLQSGAASSSDILVRRNDGTDAKPHWQYLTGNCIRERDEQNHEAYLVVAKDITSDMVEQFSNRQMALKYLKAFDISLVAMAFYNKDGKLLELNERMKDVIGVNDENMRFFYDTLLFEAPLFVGVLEPGMRDVTHACQHMVYPELGLNKYLEYRIRPVFDDEGEIRYYSVTVRDVTGERNLYREQQAIQRQLEVTNKEANKFEKQMNYLLKNSNMFIWRYDYQKNVIAASRSLHKIDATISIDYYLESVSPDERDAARNTLCNPLARNRAINDIRHFHCSPLTRREGWFAISGTPMHDKNGMCIGHFGIVRDVTQLMKSQEELRKETLRAQQSGTLKATFLANMTHEIRTPLNAIVGFSDLLHVAENAEERTEFIRIIRHNCDLLLRLIDDLLQTSEINQRLQRIETVDTDFSAFFDEVCQTVAQRVEEPNVSFIKDNPHTTFLACIDKERIQQVITNFVTNAVKYTHEGHIKVGYRMENREKNGTVREGIYIYCEDTGAGIPKEQQASVFDRFVKLNEYVQGTGLGLSICKSIAERCEGDIGVISEGEGKGSVFWLWVPRFLTSSNLSEEK